MTRVQRTDSGNYTRPAMIQAPAAYVDNGSGGNSAANEWTTLFGGNPATPLMIHLFSGNFGRGSSRPFMLQQLYPTARHWAEMRWRLEVASIPINGTQTLVVDGRRYQIIDAVDPDMEHIKILMPLVEYQAKGTKIN